MSIEFVDLMRIDFENHLTKMFKLKFDLRESSFFYLNLSKFDLTKIKM